MLSWLPMFLISHVVPFWDVGAHSSSLKAFLALESTTTPLLTQAARWLRFSPYLNSTSPANVWATATAQLVHTPVWAAQSGRSSSSSASLMASLIFVLSFLKDGVFTKSSQLRWDFCLSQSTIIRGVKKNPGHSSWHLASTLGNRSFASVVAIFWTFCDLSASGQIWTDLNICLYAICTLSTSWTMLRGSLLPLANIRFSYPHTKHIPILLYQQATFVGAHWAHGHAVYEGGLLYKFPQPRQYLRSSRSLIMDIVKKDWALTYREVVPVKSSFMAIYSINKKDRIIWDVWKRGENLLEIQSK